MTATAALIHSIMRQTLQNVEMLGRVSILYTDDKSCKSWRQAVRRLWNLPYNCHVTILEALSECLPLFDVFCKRSLNFINRCLVSDNEIGRAHV